MEMQKYAVKNFVILFRDEFYGYTSRTGDVFTFLVRTVKTRGCAAEIFSGSEVSRLNE